MKKKKSWLKKWYSQEFLDKMKENAYEEVDGNLKYTVKYPPDSISKSAIDSRMLGGPIGKSAKLICLVPDFIFNSLKPNVNTKMINSFRKSCEIVSSANCNIKGVTIKHDSVKADDGYNIPIKIYQNDNCKDTKICLCFIHGGAFVAGSLEPYDEALRMLVDKFSIKAVSIDYRYLPENKYPTLYTDCFTVINCIYNNSEKFEIDKDKIFVCGDSAGGNIAQACTTLAEDTDLIRGQLLLYPTLNIFKHTDKYYKSGLDDFKFDEKQKNISKGVVRQMQMLANCDITKIGITKPDKLNNPYTFDINFATPTFISVGALDYLKKDAFAWAHKLVDKGIKVKFVLYNGIGHGYINATGVFPQSEDLIDEMGTFILNEINA